MINYQRPVFFSSWGDTEYRIWAWNTSIKAWVLEDRNIVRHSWHDTANPKLPPLYSAWMEYNEIPYPKPKVPSLASESELDVESILDTLRMLDKELWLGHDKHHRNLQLCMELVKGTMPSYHNTLNEQKKEQHDASD